MKNELAHTCTACELHETRTQIVWGTGNLSSRLLILGDSPGFWEDRFGIPFHGGSKGGEEFTNLLRANYIDRKDIYVTKCVKCIVKKSKAVHLDTCRRKFLHRELDIVNPSVIGTVGAVATKQILGNVSMDRVHGIPFRVMVGNSMRTVVPLYDPSAGVVDSQALLWCQQDFRTLYEVLSMQREPVHLEDVFKDREFYSEMRTGLSIRNILEGHDVVAIDTEWAKNKFWCLSFSVVPGESIVVMEDRHEALEEVAKHVAKPRVLTLNHNALYDLPVLSSVGIVPARFADTMVIAYLLQSEPQGLKPLAFRHLGMVMNAYKDMVGEATKNKAIDYLNQVLMQDWLAPEPFLVWEKDAARVKQPQNIAKKSLRILNDTANKGADPADRWKKIKLNEGRGQVEAVYGEMPEGDLSDIDHDDAVDYAARDADATLRLWPILWGMIETRGLQEVFWRDMHAMLMVVDMMAAGIEVDLAHFEELSGYLQGKADVLENMIMRKAKSSFNLASPLQVSKKLFVDLGLPQIRGNSTDDKVLSRLVDKHPIIPLIREWRGYDKLLNTYTRQLPKKVQQDGRIHTTFRITRVITGRLSASNPNLMAQPTRSKEGKMVRKGFVAAEGCSFLSCDYCLTGDEKIITEYGEQPIKDIKVGTGVLSSKEGISLQFEKVIAAAKVGRAPVYKLRLEDGTSIKCTADHKLMTYEGECVELKNLRVGDRLAHVKESYAGPQKYSTWYLRNYHNSFYKHRLIAKYKYGDCPEGFEVDHKNGNAVNWHSDNIQYLPITENRAQGGRRYWRAVKNGERSDEKRLEALREGLKSRRTYKGKENPNYAKFKRDYLTCPCCGKEFVQPKCRKAIYCSHKCYIMFKTQNHKIKSIDLVGLRDIYQITVDNTHTYVSQNGLIHSNSQIEMRVAAHEGDDTNMIEIFNKSQDIHTMTAAKMWGLAVEDVDELQHRYPAKRIGFGILYDITGKGLLEQMLSQGATSTLQECEEMIEAWFRVYSGIAQFMQDTKTHAKRHGFVRDMWGRIMYVPGVKAHNMWVKLEALRKAGNAPIQMGAQGVIKQAMGDLVPVLKDLSEMGICRPLIQIHDDILFEIDDHLLPIAVPRIVDVMENAVTLKVPTPVDPKTGKDWGTMDKWNV